MSTTNFLQLPIPDFKREGWLDGLQAAFDTIDSTLENMGASASIIHGTATAGAVDSITDASLKMDVDALVGGSVLIKRAGIIHRVASIVSNTSDTVTFTVGAAAQFGDSFTLTPSAQSSVDNLRNRTHSKISKDVSGAINVVATPAENNAGYYALTGAVTADAAFIVEPTARRFVVRNDTTGAFTRTIKTAAGVGVTVEQGATASLYCNGLDVFHEAASIDSNDELVQLPKGADAEIAALRPKASPTADGGWLEGFGVGQTWQDMTASRANLVTYTNTTGRAIAIAVQFTNFATAGAFGLRGSVNGVDTHNQLVPGASLASFNASLTLTMIIPDGDTYSVTQVSSLIQKWWELRT